MSQTASGAKNDIASSMPFLLIASSSRRNTSTRSGVVEPSATGPLPREAFAGSTSLVAVFVGRLPLDQAVCLGRDEPIAEHDLTSAATQALESIGETQRHRTAPSATPFQ